jgi:hypothetical protein
MDYLFTEEEFIEAWDGVGEDTGRKEEKMFTKKGIAPNGVNPLVFL